jgi:hypothetical protein
MTNPLIEKFYELHPEKKEKPKSQKPPIVEYVDNGGSTPSQEVIEKLRQLQPNSKIISASNTSVSIKPKPLTSYDPQSGEDSFLQENYSHLKPKQFLMLLMMSDGTGAICAKHLPMLLLLLLFVRW